MLRARIVLLAAEGYSCHDIGEELGIERKTAMRWRNRFREEGFKGIEQERPGRGRKARIQMETILEIVDKTLQTRPVDATQWSLRSMAKETGLSRSTIHRIWQSRGLKPHLCETFKLSKDPDFEAKLVDVVGLYLDPPEHAVVLSVDEKTQIQALDRTQPGLPMKAWRCGTMPRLQAERYHDPFCRDGHFDRKGHRPVHAAAPASRMVEVLEANLG